MKAKGPSSAGSCRVYSSCACSVTGRPMPEGTTPLATKKQRSTVVPGPTLYISRRFGPSRYTSSVVRILASENRGFFVFLQAEEYIEAYQHMNLKLTSGIYGSTFFMLTGFHGMHVSIGAIMLTIIWLRVVRGHFTPDKHFAFEAVAWYWHFVDVVWIGLYVFVYWM